MSALARPAVRRHAFSTADPEEAREQVGEAYVRYVCTRRSGRRDRFGVRITGAGIAGLGLDRVGHTIPADALPRPVSTTNAALLVVHRLLDGALTVAVRGETTVRARLGEALLVDPGAVSCAGWDDEGADVQVAWVDRAAVCRLGEELSGQPADRVRFTLSSPINAARARRCGACQDL